VVWWVVRKLEIITNSAQLGLGLGLSLAKIDENDALKNLSLQ